MKMTFTSPYYDQNGLVSNSAKNEKTFSDLYKKHRERVFAIGFCYVRCHSLANDISQEVFSNIWLHWERLKSEGRDLKSYIAVAAHNTSKTYLKNQRRIIGDDALYTRQSAQMAESVECKMLFEMVKRKGVLKLTPQQKIVFNMTLECGLDYLEIAREMNISPSTVKQHRLTAFNAIRSFLKQVA